MGHRSSTGPEQIAGRGGDVATMHRFVYCCYYGVLLLLLWFIVVVTMEHGVYGRSIDKLTMGIFIWEYHIIYLVGAWNMLSIYWEQSPQLTNSYFSEG